MPSALKVLETRNDAREWFNARIHERNMTQDDVARCCEVNIRTLRSWLSSSRISRDQVPMLCEVLDVTATELAKYFRVSSQLPYPSQRASALDKVKDLTALLRAVLDVECEKITLADLEVVVALPFDFSAGLSADEITTVQTLLRVRQKKNKTKSDTQG